MSFDELLQVPDLLERTPLVSSGMLEWLGMAQAAAYAEALERAQTVYDRAREQHPRAATPAPLEARWPLPNRKRM